MSFSKLDRHFNFHKEKLKIKHEIEKKIIFDILFTKFKLEQ
jgi:hypothetical protein